MSRVTSKLQVTVPKQIAQQYAIRPGDEIDWLPAGDGIRVVKRASAGKKASTADATAVRLRAFDEATKRQTRRNGSTDRPPGSADDRGWTREDLYRRGRAD